MKRKLYRSVANRKIAGVCAGLADFFGIEDVTPLRLAWALLTLLAGLSIWVYLLCWIVIPNEPSDHRIIDEQ
ncbi:MAG: PspC domain-containing protein [Bacteroidales bacterium]|nr:PspC domain-containing protein [Bacteroidales bacterium]